MVFDTFLAGYLLDPAATEYPLRALSEKYLGVDVLGEIDGEDEGQLFSDARWRPVAADAAAIALLAPVMEEQIEGKVSAGCLETVEMPLASVLAHMEELGVALDVAYLEQMGGQVRARMAELQAEIYRDVGEEFNLNSPPAAPRDPLREARAVAGQAHAQRAAVDGRPACWRSCGTIPSWMRSWTGASSTS